MLGKVYQGLFSVPPPHTTESGLTSPKVPTDSGAQTQIRYGGSMMVSIYVWFLIYNYKLHNLSNIFKLCISFTFLDKHASVWEYICIET